MIRGLGVDIVRIERFESWLADQGLMRRYFTSEEIAYVRSQGTRATESLAARFAAKEALGKALGTGLAGFDLRDVEVTRNEVGQPSFRFHGRTAERLGQMGRLHLSLSHDAAVAVAVVIWED